MFDLFTCDLFTNSSKNKVSSIFGKGYLVRFKNKVLAKFMSVSSRLLYFDWVLLSVLLRTFVTILNQYHTIDFLTTSYIGFRHDGRSR